jgi:hypothetical protein
VVGPSFKKSSPYLDIKNFSGCFKLVALITDMELDTDFRLGEKVFSIARENIRRLANTMNVGRITLKLRRTPRRGLALLCPCFTNSPKSRGS